MTTSIINNTANTNNTAVIGLKFAVTEKVMTTFDGTVNARLLAVEDSNHVFSCGTMSYAVRGDLNNGVFVPNHNGDWVIEELDDILDCRREAVEGDNHLSLTLKVDGREKYKELGISYDWKDLLGRLNFRVRDGKVILISRWKDEMVLQAI